MKTDTIAAIATALSDAGIGVIRISGENAIEVGNSVFCSGNGKKILDQVESHTLHYGFIVSDTLEQNENWKQHIIDEVMISVMKAPRSYTREDTVEISCHGGLIVMQKILDAVLQNGARLAEPGEFTKRAFLNGRIDLSKAEAVMDVISSQNDYAYEAAIRQLGGNLSEKIRELRESVLYEIAFIESALDDPEHISLEGYPDRLSEKIDQLCKSTGKLIDSAENGRLIKGGIATVIVGKPNAGKSSLLNLILGEERAIVTDIAGTTRDVLQESIRLHGIGLNIIDTAGIRDTQDVVEKIGVEKAKQYAKDADLIIYVVDASVELDDSDREIISLLGEKNTIILLNKSDLDTKVTEETISQLIAEVLKENRTEQIKMIRTSTKENVGIEELENVIKEMFFQGAFEENNEIVITNMRHKEALQDAYNSFQLVQKSIADGMPEDFYSIDLMNAYSSLGKIIGEEVEDDLVEEIFSKFCMGK